MLDARVWLTVCCALSVTALCAADGPTSRRTAARPVGVPSSASTVARRGTDSSAPISATSAAQQPEELPAPPREPTSKGTAQATDEVVLPGNGEIPPEIAWRYRFHLSRWWYFVEPGHWLFWDGHCWQDARPAATKIMPDGSVQRTGLARRVLAPWPQVPSYREHHGWVGGFYSSGGGYGDAGFGYGYGVPNYGPAE